MWRIGFILFVTFIGLSLAPYSARASGLVNAPNNLGLVGYWTFNDQVGTKATDSSGLGNTGTLTSSPTWTTAGKHAGSLNFSGSNYVDVGNGSSLQISGSGSAVTLSAWIFVASRPAAGDYTIISKGYEAANQSEWRMTMMGQSGADPVVFFRTVATTGRSHKTTSTLPLGQWVHVVATCTYGASAPAIYFNGQAQAIVVDDSSASVYNFPTTANSVNIGRVTNNTAFFTGSIDDVRIYNRVLSVADISLLHGSGAVKQKASANLGLVGYWSLDDASGTKATDSSGRGGTGVLTNMDAATDWVAGRYGKALDFDGTDDILLIPDADVFTGTELTVSGWAKATAGGANMLFGKGNLGTGYSWYFTIPTVISFYASGGASAETVEYGPRANIWAFYSIVYNGAGSTNADKLKIYIDGVNRSLTFTGTIPSSLNNDTGNLSVGGIMYNSTPYQLVGGLVDDVRIYNRALSAAEVLSLYQSSGAVKVNASQNNKLTSGLVGLWSFNGQDIAGTTAYDRSGQGNNGVLTNGPVPDAGKIGQGMKFDGVNDYVSLPNVAALSGVGSYSIGGWVSLGSFPSSGNTKYMISKGADVPTPGWGIQAGAYNNGGTQRWIASVVTTSPSTVQYNAIGGTPVLNEWTHLLAVFNSSDQTITLYANGVQLAQTNTGNTLRHANTSAIGVGADLVSGSWPGMIDDVRVYNRALSATEALQLYKQGK